MKKALRIFFSIVVLGGTTYVVSGSNAGAYPCCGSPKCMDC
ncbi:hypothetical protein [Deinococcus cavernae]|nr:hypothetical protein [Deinococcus cavernae]